MKTIHTHSTTHYIPRRTTGHGLHALRAAAALTLGGVLMAATSQAESAVPGAVVGRYVRVMLPGGNRTLSLAEVQVFSGTTNVALNKRTVQNSTDHGGVSGRAVDGNTAGDWGKNSVTHTTENTTDPLWEVDLGTPVPVDRIVLWNRDGYAFRLDGCRVMLLDHKRKVVWGATKDKCGPGANPLVIKDAPTCPWMGTQLAKCVGTSPSSGLGSNPEALRLAINDLLATFGERYPRGKEFLQRLDDLEAADGAPGNAIGCEDLQRDALLANPLMNFDKLLLIKRGAGNLGLPQNWQANCGVGSTGYDNEIAVLSPVSPQGNLTTLMKPTKSEFVGDLKLDFGGDKMLFSM
ncbi:MAG: discoidin domain-containing protein, partial [Verrucomicrobia bacterium]|nr:discoidin domain-containing protein [Verrucomicrobiota bacterium]